MKKNYSKILAIAATLLGYSAVAQVASLYTFSQFGGAYTPIPYTAPGATIIASANEDDNLYGNIPIGFSFNYNNIAFTQINLNVNGWIAMGPATQFNSYGAISGGIVNAIAFWSGDDQLGPSQSASTTNGSNVVTFTFPSGGQYFEPGDVVSGGNIPGGTTVLAVSASNMTISTNATGTGAVTLNSTGQISYLTSGAAPSRTFTIQWRKLGHWSTTGTGLNDYFNAQIKLYETTNIIDIVYGKCGTGGGTTTNHQIGLSGNTSADFNNRTVANGGLYSASTAGASNAATCTFNTGTAPALGQTYRWAPPQCSGTLSQLTTTASILSVCPNGATNLSLLNTYTVAGITYSWAAATLSNVGPFNLVSGANGSAYNATNITTPVWYQLVSTCLNSNSTASSVPVGITVQGITTSQVPYNEDFEGIATNNQLPNCSWAATNLGSTSLTYISSNNQNRVPRSGNKFASFYYSPANNNTFYSNGIQLYAGVTYSASMWYTTEYFGYNTWSLNMRVGPNQSNVGAVSIASNTYAASPNYKSLSNTFSVPTSGIYYIGVNAISNGVCCGNYLSWDDLQIIVPCQLNTPTLSLNGTTASSICAGQAVNLTVSGANTYTWNTGSNSATINDNPMFTTNYVAAATNTASGCSATISKNITVYSLPQVSVFSFDPNACEGEAVSITAIGANTYTWNTGANGQVLVTTPTTTGSVSYTVIGAYANGCTNMASQTIMVNPLPNVTAVNVPTVSCVGDKITLTGSGATTYQWMSNFLYVQGTQVNAMPLVSTIYSVTGTDANGCSKMAIVNHAVEVCTGLSESFKPLVGLSVYPNPNNGMFSVELNNGLNKTIELMDVSGRVILSESSVNSVIDVNISTLANGIYYVKVKSDKAVEVLKVVKQ